MKFPTIETLLTEAAEENKDIFSKRAVEGIIFALSAALGKQVDEQDAGTYTGLHRAGRGARMNLQDMSAELAFYLVQKDGEFPLQIIKNQADTLKKVVQTIRAFKNPFYIKTDDTELVNLHNRPLAMINRSLDFLNDILGGKKEWKQMMKRGNKPPAEEIQQLAHVYLDKFVYEIEELIGALSFYVWPEKSIQSMQDTQAALDAGNFESVFSVEKVLKRAEELAKFADIDNKEKLQKQRKADARSHLRVIK